MLPDTSKNVIVRFLKRWRGFNSRETGGFGPDQYRLAGQLIEANIAEPIQLPDGVELESLAKMAKAPDRNPELSEQHRKRVNETRRMFRAVPPSMCDKSGKPKLEAIQRLVDPAVTQAILEEAWAGWKTDDGRRLENAEKEAARRRGQVAARAVASGASA